MVLTKEVKEIRECDRLRCQRRKGVVSVNVEISRPDIEGAGRGWQGDLCPYHYNQLVLKNELMFGGKDDPSGTDA